jgi:hypothetical protein
MDLSQLAFAGYIFRKMADDESLAALRAKIGAMPDLGRIETALAILQLLNKWKCRLREVDFDTTARELANWQDACGKFLPPNSISLLEMKETDLERAALAYADLFNRKADRRRRFQATATAKTLFFLRPNAFPPWDEAIRDGLNYDGGSESYLRFLKESQIQLLELKKSCEAAGVDVAQVPGIIYRPASTLAKLVDEYNWVTITRGIRPPDWLTLVQWTAWSMAGDTDKAIRPLHDSLMAVVRDPNRIWVDPNALWELREVSKL